MAILSMSSPYCVPTFVMDIIQSYSLWGNKNNSYRISSYVSDIDYGFETIPEIFEEYEINGSFLTSRISTQPYNYSIVLMESKQSNLTLITEDNEDDIEDVDNMGINSVKLKCNRVKKQVGVKDKLYESDIADPIYILQYVPFVCLTETSSESNLVKQILKEIEQNDRSLIEEFKKTMWTDIRNEKYNYFSNDMDFYSNILEIDINKLDILNMDYIHSVAKNR